MARRYSFGRLSVRDRWAVALMAALILVASSATVMWGIRSAASGLTAWAVSWRTFAERVKNPNETTVAALEQCQTERADFAARIATLQVTSKEYQDAARYFARPRADAWRNVLGRVVALAGGSSPWHVRLDVGSADGVAVGQAVLGPSGTLVGVVEGVGEHTSVVRYVGALTTRLAVSTGDSGVTIGLLEGTDGEEVVVNYIPRGTSLKEGDILVTSGLSSDLPIGLAVAVVKSIVDTESEPFLTAMVVPLEKATDITTVSVLVAPPAPTLAL